MKKKRERKAIYLGMKIAILDRLGRGERCAALCKQFHLPESTIRAIKKNEFAIRKSAFSGTNVSCKLSSYTRCVLIEKNGKGVSNLAQRLNTKKNPCKRLYN